VLVAARIYIQLRWLGAQQGRLPEREYTGFLEALHRYASEMELI
jgi:hypothetical protein